VNEFQQHIGVGQPSRAFSLRAGTQRTTTVTADDGPRRGRFVGHHVDHWDDRRDAIVYAPHTHITATTKET
jgi:hypothetical protein